MQVLGDVEILNKKEETIQVWIMYQVHDHLDQGKATIDYLEENHKGSSFDKRFMKEIWVPLYKSIYASLTSPEESNFHSPKYLIGLVDSYFISILSKYFSDEPKSAFDQIQTLSEAMNKIFSEDSES